MVWSLGCLLVIWTAIGSKWTITLSQSLVEWGISQTLVDKRDKDNSGKQLCDINSHVSKSQPAEIAARMQLPSMFKLRLSLRNREGHSQNRSKLWIKPILCAMQAAGASICAPDYSYRVNIHLKLLNTGLIKKGLWIFKFLISILWARTTLRVKMWVCICTHTLKPTESQQWSKCKNEEIFFFLYPYDY